MAAWSAQLIGGEAMERVFRYETKQGREPEKVHTSRKEKEKGYDIESGDAAHKRFIEVKGVTQHWKNYTWQSLHRNEYMRLKENADNFFLYIVYFPIDPKDRSEENLKKSIPEFYIIPGRDLLDEKKFRIQEESYALRATLRTSFRSRLQDYKQNNE
jgi:hypothetical protein